MLLHFFSALLQRTATRSRLHCTFTLYFPLHLPRRGPPHARVRQGLAHSHGVPHVPAGAVRPLQLDAREVSHSGTQ